MIHPTVIIEGEVEIGENTTVGPYSYLKGPLVIGKNNTICAHVQIGVDPEHKTKPPVGTVYIGNGNTIREFSVIQRGIGDLETCIEDDCYIMAYSYIAHDSLIESGVILCARTSLGGHCRILKRALLGIGSSLHHMTTVGAHAFVGMGSIVVKDIPPFYLVRGNPARFARLHDYSFKELELSPTDFQMIDGEFRSHHPYIKKCLTQFEKHSRRSLLAC